MISTQPRTIRRERLSEGERRCLESGGVWVSLEAEVLRVKAAPGKEFDS